MGWTFIEGSTDEVVSALAGVNIFSFDIETTGLNPFDSRILLWQIGLPTKQMYVIRASADVDKLLPFLGSSKWTKLIHNAKFEQKFIQYFTNTTIKGVFDTMLAEQVITSEKYPRSLDHLALKYASIKVDKTLQKSFIGMHPQEMFTDEQLQYAATDVEILFPIYEKQKEELEKTGQSLIARIESDCAGVVAAMELEGIPLDVDKWRNVLQEYINQEHEKKQQIFSVLLDDSPLPEQQGLFERAGINLKSPKQLAEAMLAIGIDLPQNTRGNYMTDERTLEKIKHPVAKDILEYRGIVKIIDAYGESFLDNIHPFTGRIHPDFHQIGAETGRFSCRDPNVQQIPAKFRRLIGGLDDYVIVGADYGQMELRIIAELSQDSALIKAFELGGDPHASTAAQMFGIPLDKVSKDQRHIAKTINFGLSYGMGVPKLMDMINAKSEKKLTFRDTDRIYKKYTETYAGVFRWFMDAGNAAYRRGYSETLGGRRRLFMRPAGGLPEREFSNQVAAIKRQGGNAPIQGTNADITKLALATVYSDLSDYGYRAHIINAVHDEIILLAHKSQTEEIREVVTDSMLRAAQELIKSVPVQVDSYADQWWAK